MPRKSGFHRTFLIRTKSYFDHSSIQGLRYITESGRHLTERIFWLIICSASFFGTYTLLKATWKNFQNNSVSFVVETSYLDWNTTFAAVSICESDSPDKIFETGNKLFGKDRNMNLDFYLRDIVFYDGTCYSCKSHCAKGMNCPRDIDYIIAKTRAPCEKLLKRCSWNSVTFDCCSQFLPLATETGLCFTINSLHTRSPANGNKMKLIVNRFTGPGRLELMVFEAAKLYIHSPEDVPFVNHPQEEKALLSWGSLFTLLYQVNEISNDLKLSEVGVAKRNCRFPHENTLTAYSWYSYSACVVNCRALAQLNLCNCTHHFVPNIISSEVKSAQTTCSLEGLACLTEHSEMLRALKTKDSTKKGLICNCQSSCTEPEYTIIQKEQSQNEEYPEDMSDYGSKVSVLMDALPSQRFKRNVVRTPLDLIVSMGGAGGLFLGASLLSLCELLVFAFIRRNRGQESRHHTDKLREKRRPRHLSRQDHDTRRDEWSRHIAFHPDIRNDRPNPSNQKTISYLNDELSLGRSRDFPSGATLRPDHTHFNSNLLNRRVYPYPFVH